MLFSSAPQEGQRPCGYLRLNTEACGNPADQLGRSDFVARHALPAARLQAIASKVQVFPVRDAGEQGVTHHVPGEGGVPDLEKHGPIDRLGLERDSSKKIDWGLTSAPPGIE
jgi:hypothetical protein